MKILSPVSVLREYTQELQGTVADVVPLLCPVREAEWIEGWEPEVVFTRSGHAEEDCAFVTSDRGEEAVWIITRHDRDAGIVEMVKTIPAALVTRIRIRLEEVGEGRTLAHVAYRNISLSPRGDGMVAALTPERWEAFMRRWEERLNHFLATGRMLTEPGP
jgi:hypothetical protein